MGSPEEWASVLAAACREMPATTIHRLPGWTEVRGDGVAHAAKEVDMVHLEYLTRANYIRKLPSASADEAAEMLDRFSEWRVLRAALENPDPAVRELAMTHLREFAEAGDPFSLAILEGREIP